MDQERQKELLIAKRVLVSLDIAMEVIHTIEAGKPLYQLYTRSGGSTPLCGKGTAYKIKKLFEEGQLDFLKADVSGQRAEDTETIEPSTPEDLTSPTKGTSSFPMPQAIVEAGDSSQGEGSSFLLVAGRLRQLKLTHSSYLAIGIVLFGALIATLNYLFG